MGEVAVILDATDALLLQAHLRSDRYKFAEAENEVMTGMLDRVEKALDERAEVVRRHE